MGKTYKSNHKYNTWRKQSKKSPKPSRIHELNEDTMRAARIEHENDKYDPHWNHH